MKNLGVTTLVLGIALFGFAIFLGRSDKAAQERMVYWEQRMDSELPRDSTRDEIMMWARHSRVDLKPMRDDQHLSATLERVPGRGSIRFSCGDMDVVVDIELDPFDHGVSRIIHTVSGCL